METAEERCHCGSPFEGSDHCPFCYCERYEAYCDAEYIGPLPFYTNEDLHMFVLDMRKAGLPVEHYHGRYFWEGPAVRVDDLHTAMMETRVPLQWDSMGMGYIVYPVAREGTLA